MERANFPLYDPRSIPTNDTQSSNASPALWLPPRRLARPESPMESQTSTTTSLYRSASASGSVEDHVASKENKTSTKVRSPNWSDAEIRFLIGLWKDRYPISKRHNSAVWESIAKELNSLLREQGLASIRTAAQCKAKKKNLADDYKRVKDRNNKSGNGSGTFTYFEELNEILGCRAKITPKTVIECGFDDNNSAIPGPSCQAMEELSESGDSESDEEEQTLSQVPFRCELAAKKEKSPLASTLNSSKQNGQKSFKRKPGSQPDNNASSFSNQPPVKRLKRRESSGQSSGSAEYFSFLNESQKRDHEFFERLAEKEAEREIKSQELMVSMVKEVAKIFKGE
ncbi:uncharacterized protein [Montipora foliosa]|uniref:uncharacterized protein isoform X3 n=1 Tax=Montipora foliosa TaxID=591990 RepID=UPI0035F19A6E